MPAEVSGKRSRREGGQRVAGIGADAVEVALAPDEQAQALGEGGGAQGQRAETTHRSPTSGAFK